MNHRSSGSLSLSKAIEGFLSFKSAEGLSDRTVDSYERLLEKWVEHQGDEEIPKVKAADITGYLSWLRTDYTPHRFSGKTDRLSPKTLRNAWVTLASFFTWASRELQRANVIKDVPSPKFKAAPVIPRLASRPQKEGHQSDDYGIPQIRTVPSELPEAK